MTDDLFKVPNKADASHEPQSLVNSSWITDLALGFNKTGVVSGCDVTFTASTARTVTVSSGTIMVASTTATVTGANVQLTAADATNDRIDIIKSSSSGTLGYVTGTAAAVPIEPSLGANEVKLAAVYVVAGGSTTYQLSANEINSRRVKVQVASAGAVDDASAIIAMEIFV